MQLHDALLSYFQGKASFDDVVTFAMRSEVQPPSKSEYIALLQLYGDEDSLNEDCKAKYIKQAILFNDSRRELLNKSYHKNVPKSRAIQTIFAALESANVVHECPCRGPVKCSVSGRGITSRNGTELTVESDGARVVFYVKNSRRRLLRDWFILRHADEQMRLVHAWATCKGSLQHNSLVTDEYERLVDSWRAINAYVAS